MATVSSTAEQQRLAEAHERGIPWRKWGPYLSERQWGTVREDYSEKGDAWNFFTHDHARSRAYRWGEDGLAGFSDDKQRLCFALALWNGKDPILKERLFGLTNSEGNHGEDVKEYYFYLDSTPTHSYMKYLYKYPQAAYPYADLVETNRRRTRNEFEYELLHTGVFNEDRYFDVFVEYAKEAPEDILITVTVHNRVPEERHRLSEVGSLKRIQWTASLGRLGYNATYSSPMWRPFARPCLTLRYFKFVGLDSKRRISANVADNAKIIQTCFADFHVHVGFPTLTQSQYNAKLSRLPSCSSASFTDCKKSVPTEISQFVMNVFLAV